MQPGPNYVACQHQGGAKRADQAWMRDQKIEIPHDAPSNVFLPRTPTKRD